MTRKQYYALKAKQERERINQICRDYPIEKVQAILGAGLSDEEAGKRLGITGRDFKILVLFYRAKGDL